MKVLVACEFSGRVRDAFASLGHDAWSCDLLPSETPGNHIQDDVLKYLGGWDLMIAHPPCTYLTTAGNAWNKVPGRSEKREEALEFVQKLLNAPVPRVALENPVSVISTAIRSPDQYIQPYEYGDRDRKKTCLWLKGLPRLVPTKIVEPILWLSDDGRRRSFTHYISTSKLDKEERTKARSRTYKGIAEAMAEQWGGQV